MSVLPRTAAAFAVIFGLVAGEDARSASLQQLLDLVPGELAGATISAASARAPGESVIDAVVGSSRDLPSGLDVVRPTLDGAVSATVAGQAQPVLVVAPGAFGMGHVARLAGALEAACYRRMRMGGLVAWRNGPWSDHIAAWPGFLVASPRLDLLRRTAAIAMAAAPGLGRRAAYRAAIAAVDDEIRAARIVIVGQEPAFVATGSRHGRAWIAVGRVAAGPAGAAVHADDLRSWVHARLPAAMTGTSESAVVRFPATGLSVAVIRAAGTDTPGNHLYKRLAEDLRDAAEDARQQASSRTMPR